MWCLPPPKLVLLVLLQAPAEPPVPTDVLEQEQSFVVATAPQPAPQQQQQQQQNQQQQQRQQRQQQQQQVLLPDDDPRWRAVLRSHAAYLSYMQQLAGMVVSKQQQGHQLVYQVRQQQGAQHKRHSSPHCIPVQSLCVFGYCCAGDRWEVQHSACS
jgi:flagellar biosynthesis component FlhA